MLLLADISLRDERPSKRRKIEDGNKQVPPSLAAQSQRAVATPSSGPSCSVCSSQSVKWSSSTCPSCQNIVCNKCTAVCDATLLTAQPPTPPLLSDSDSASGSSPSTPNRYSTPEPFDPQLLRARLSAAAAATTGAHAHAHLYHNPQHHHHHQQQHATNNINAHGLTPPTSQHSSTLYIGNTGILKKRKRQSCCGSSSTTQSISLQPYSDPAAVNVSVNGHQQQSQQRFQGFFKQQAPSAFDSMYTDIDTSLCAKANSGSTGHGSCSVRLCTNCLVTTADGHKICFDCLEESFAC